MLCRGDAPVHVWDPECMGGQRAGCPGLGGGRQDSQQQEEGGMCAPSAPRGLEGRSLGLELRDWDPLCG